MRAPFQLDLHVPNFNWPDVTPEHLFERLVEIATTAEESGFSSISLMDHLHQIPAGRPAGELHVRGQHDARRARRAHVDDPPRAARRRRHVPQPGAASPRSRPTIDVISGGRAVLGLGAAWFEDEHQAYGFDFPPLKERFERLEDALQIARTMFTAGGRDLRGQALPRRRRVQQPEADPRRHPDPDRRQRRAQDAALRGQVRRRLEPLRRRRARQAPARRARGPLRGRRPRPGRDHQDPHGRRSHRAARTRRRRRRSRPAVAAGADPERVRGQAFVGDARRGRRAGPGATSTPASTA